MICGSEQYKQTIKPKTKQNTHFTEQHGAALQGEDILKANIYKFIQMILVMLGG